MKKMMARRLLSIVLAASCVFGSLALLASTVPVVQAQTISETTERTEDPTPLTLQYSVGLFGDFNRDGYYSYGWLVRFSLYGSSIQTGIKLGETTGVFGNTDVKATEIEYDVPIGDGSTVEYTLSNAPNAKFTGGSIHIKLSWQKMNLNVGFRGDNNNMPEAWSSVTGTKVEAKDNNGTWHTLGQDPNRVAILGVTKSLNAGNIQRTFRTTTRNYHEPKVTTNPDAEVKLGQAVDAEFIGSGITALWGQDATKLIAWNDKINGTITNTTLTGKYDEDLSSDGTVFDQLGVKEHTYEIKDSHSLSTEAEYAGDNTKAETSRKVIVSTDAAPGLDLTVNGSGAAYNNEWMAPNGKNADPDRQHGVDVTAHSSDPGNYNISLKQDVDTLAATTWVQKNPVQNPEKKTATATNYNTETPKEGTPFHAVLTGESTFSNILLSPQTAEKRVFIDNTAPTVTHGDASAENDYSKITATVNDALSGSAGAYYTIVQEAQGDVATQAVTAPTTPVDGTDWTPIEQYARPTSNGTYHVYVYGKDNASNRSDAELAATFTLKSVAGNVVWDDANDQDGRRPQSVTVRLLQDGKEVQTQQVAAANNWAFSFDGLLETASNGQAITYTVTQDAVTDYSTAVNGYTITNSHTPGKTSVSAVVGFEDGDNADGLRPESVTLHLLANGVDTGETVTVTAAENWQHSFTNLDEYLNGQKVAYTVTQDAVTDYTTVVTGDMTTGFTAMNTHTPVQTSVNVTVDWQDGDDADRLRPQSVTVRLLADGVDTGKTLTLDAASGWKGSFANLGMNRDQGVAVVYTVEQEPIAGYETQVLGASVFDFTITNTHEVKMAVAQTSDTTDLTGYFAAFAAAALLGTGAVLLTKRKKKAE